MRTILGPPAEAIQRRGIAIERAAMVTLRRDAYATPPGPTLGLAIGERTTYRPGAWLLDTFDRPALGASYPAWGGTAGLVLDAGRAVPAALGVHQMARHTRALPRDQWVGLLIDALAGPNAIVGVLLRATATGLDGYRVRATPTATLVERRDAAGVGTTLDIVGTPWRPGDQLRVELGWDRLRVYRNTICVADVTDAAGLASLAGRHPGLTALAVTGEDTAAIGAWYAGELRQEWLGAGLDLGDVQRALGQPASFDLTLSNVAPMGGADRFAALLRHGLNTEGTYDLDRGAVRVLTVIDGLSPPLTAGVGVIDGVSDLTEDRVRLACRGRDAFLTPQLAPGPVTYLAGPPPGGLTPLPPDPCAPSTPPEIVPGDPPPEPVDPVTADGVGPEAPPAPPPPPLLGLWMLTMGYHVDGDGHEVPLLGGGTTVTAWSMNGPTDGGAQTVYLEQIHAPAVVEADVGSQGMLWMYRGPDVVGTHLSVPTAAHGGYPGLTLRLRRQSETGHPPATPVATCTFPGLTVRVVHYSGAGIATVADLQALQPGRLVPPWMPVRVETLATFSFPSATITAGFSPPLVQVLDLAGDAVPLNAFIGPQIIGLELEPVFASAVEAGETGDARTGVDLFAYYAAGAVNFQNKSVCPEAP